MAHACSHCGASNAPQSCVACKAAYYCAVSCQKAHWPTHKAPCRAHAAAWRPVDTATYGEWAPRLHGLLSERPIFSTRVVSWDDVVLMDKVWPLRAITSLTSPHPAPSVALEVLALAGEARAAAGSAPSASARRTLQRNAFYLTLLAASPDSGVPPRLPPGTLPSEPPPLPDAVVAKALRAMSCPALPLGGAKILGGGNAEAQYLVGLAYCTGEAPGCPEGDPLFKPAVFWMLMADTGGHVLARAWLQRMGFRCP